MKDFLTFKKMITPIIIQIIFWIGALACVIGGLILMGQRCVPGFVGFICALLGPVGVRIICEILIVIFSINDTLTDVKIC